MVLTFGNTLMFYVSLNEINKDGKGQEKIYKTEQTEINKMNSTVYAMTTVITLKERKNQSKEHIQYLAGQENYKYAELFFFFLICFHSSMTEYSKTFQVYYMIEQKSKYVDIWKQDSKEERIYKYRMERGKR